MHLAGDSIEKNDACYGELSTNGGASWSPVVEILDGDGSGTYRSGTVSPAGASNNANLRLRFRLAGKGKGDYCWGDEVVVTGVPLGGGTAAAKTTSGSLQVEAQDNTGLSVALGDSTGQVGDYGSRGFDPGFDHLAGDGTVSRSALSFAQLMSGDSAGGASVASAYTVPAGAANPQNRFEGVLALSGSGLPPLQVELVQVGNHLYPLDFNGMQTPSDYLVDTGRVWQETADRGFSRAGLPFALVQEGSSCVQQGIVSFLFRDDGATSKAAYRLTGASCGDTAAVRQGVLDAQYTPAATGGEVLDIGSVMGCAAESWLPLVQGEGGISLMLLPDGTESYVLSESKSTSPLWLNGAAAMRSLCD